MRIYTLFLSVLTATSLFTGSTVYANDIPPIKAGLWETVSQTEGKSSHCTDKENIEKLLKSANSPMKSVCNEIEIRKAGSVYKYDVKCQIMGSTLNVSSTIEGDFSKRYVSRTTSRFSPPLFGKAVEKSEEVSTYKGPCPSDMKPGDVKLANGQKMNTNEAAKSLESMPDMGELMKQMPDMQNVQKMLEQMRNMGAGQ